MREGHNIGDPPEMTRLMTASYDYGTFTEAGPRETIPLLVNDDSGREIMRITNERRLVFAPDVEPTAAAKLIAEYVSQAFRWEMADVPVMVKQKEETYV